MQSSTATRDAFLAMTGLALGHLTFGLVSRIQTDSLGMIAVVEVPPVHPLGDTLSSRPSTNCEGLLPSSSHPSNAQATEIIPKIHAREQRGRIVDSDDILETLQHSDARKISSPKESEFLAQTHPTQPVSGAVSEFTPQDHSSHCQTAFSSRKRHMHVFPSAPGSPGFGEVWDHLSVTPQFVHSIVRQPFANSGKLLIENEGSPQSSILFAPKRDELSECGLFEPKDGFLQLSPAVTHQDVISNKNREEIYSSAEGGFQTDGNLGTGTDASSDTMLTGVSPSGPHLTCCSSLLPELGKFHDSQPSGQKPSFFREDFGISTQQHGDSTVDLLKAKQTQAKGLNTMGKYGNTEVFISASPELESTTNENGEGLTEGLTNLNPGHQMQAETDLRISLGDKEEGPASETVMFKPLNSKQVINISMAKLKSDMKLFAWISSTTFETLEPARVQIENLKDTIIAEVRNSDPFILQWLFPHLKNFIPDEKYFYNSIIVLEDLIEKLWYINGKFLEQFGLKPSEILFQTEQEQLLDWLSCFFIFSRKKMRFSLCSLPGIEEAEVESSHKLKQIIQIILHQEDQRCVWGVESLRTKLFSEYSAHEINLTKIAVLLLGTYFKTTNYIKWKSIFPNDIYFVKLLARIRYHQFSQKYTVHGTISDPYSLPFQPWQKDWSDNCILGNAHQHFLRSTDKFIPFGNSCVRMIEKQMMSNESTRNLSLRNESSKLYQYLAKTHRNAKVRYAALLNSGLEISDSLQNFIPNEKIKRTVIPFFQDVAHKSLSMNRKLLEILGAESSTLYFDEEQKALHKWILERALFHIKRTLCTNFDSSIGDPSAWMFESNELDETLLELFNTGVGNDSRIQVKYNEKYGTLIMKEVVDMLYSYYKTTNLNKWKSLFIHDNRFLKLLVDIHMQVHNHNFTRKKNYSKSHLKEFNIIPWKSEFFYDSLKYQRAIRENFGPIFSKEYLFPSLNEHASQSSKKKLSTLLATSET